jgi:hypothetical protein
MDRRKLIGFGVMVAVVLAALAWVISSSDPQGSLDVLGPVFVGIMAVALAAVLLADRRFFDAPRRIEREALLSAVLFVVGVKLLIDGRLALAVAAAIGIAVLVVIAVRQRPRAEESTIQSS